MPLGGYSNVSWFFRAVRLLSVVAFAALVGGMMGGLIYAIDSALTWEPRPDARAENQAAAPDPQRSGATLDPSVGMTAPSPAPQPRSAPAPSQAQVPPQLLTPKPLGPATPLQMQNEPKRVQTVPQPQNQTAQTPTPTGSVATPQQQATRWPDALSRAHQATTNRITTNQTPPNPATANPQQESEPTNAQANPRAASTSADADRKEAKDREAKDREARDREAKDREAKDREAKDREAKGREAKGREAKDREAKDRKAKGVATADDQGRPSRRGRHDGRQRATITANAPHSTGDDADAAAAPGSRRQDARAHNRLYDFTATVGIGRTATRENSPTATTETTSTTPLRGPTCSSDTRPAGAIAGRGSSRSQAAVFLAAVIAVSATTETNCAFYAARFDCWSRWRKTAA